VTALSVASVAKISASVMLSLAPKRGRGAARLQLGSPPATKQNLKDTDVVDMMISGF